jgi:hypothetical protein
MNLNSPASGSPALSKRARKMSSTSLFVPGASRSIQGSSRPPFSFGNTAPTSLIAGFGSPATSGSNSGLMVTASSAVPPEFEQFRQLSSAYWTAIEAANDPKSLVIEEHPEGTQQGQQNWTELPEDSHISQEIEPLKGKLI